MLWCVPYVSLGTIKRALPEGQLHRQCANPTKGAQRPSLSCRTGRHALHHMACLHRHSQQQSPATNPQPQVCQQVSPSCQHPPSCPASTVPPPPGSMPLMPDMLPPPAAAPSAAAAAMSRPRSASWLALAAPPGRPCMLDVLLCPALAQVLPALLLAAMPGTWRVSDSQKLSTCQGHGAAGSQCKASGQLLPETGHRCCLLGSTPAWTHTTRATSNTFGLTGLQCRVRHASNILALLPGPHTVATNTASCGCDVVRQQTTHHNVSTCVPQIDLTSSASISSAPLDRSSTLSMPPHRSSTAWRGAPRSPPLLRLLQAGTAPPPEWAAQNSRAGSS